MLAVFVTYMLVLLAPLHQAAGLQRDLNAAGFSTLSTWSVCADALPDRGDAPVKAVKCAVSGIGKKDLMAPEPAVLDVGLFRLAEMVRHVDRDMPSGAEHRGFGAQPRAPPALV